MEVGTFCTPQLGVGGVLSTMARVSHAKTQSDNTLFALKLGKCLVAQHYSR